MRDKGVAGSWHLGPSMRPGNLAERLRVHGFDGAPEPGMAAALSDLPDIGVLEDLQIERVADAKGLDAYESVLAQGFGEGPVEAAWVRAVFAEIGVGDHVPWRHYVGAIDQQPVATATLFFAADVAGLYFVSTVPAWRGRGIGSAISRAALAGARDLGFAVAVLGSSPMGQRVYERLGFREVCAVEVYEWSPSDSSSAPS